MPIRPSGAGGAGGGMDLRPSLATGRTRLRLDWRAPAYALASAVLAFAAGGTWWLASASALLAVAPGRLAAAAAGIGCLLANPTDANLAGTILAFASGILATACALTRIHPSLPWVALPYAAGALGILWAAWPVLPPDGFWTESDVATRARLLVLAAAAALLMAPTYRPGYRKAHEAPPPGTP